MTVNVEYVPPAGKLGAVVAQMFGEHPEQQIREDMRRLKQLMETGEIPTTVGQPHGRRTAFVRMLHAATNEEPRRERKPSLVVGH